MGVTLVEFIKEEKDYHTIDTYKYKFQFYIA